MCLMHGRTEKNPRQGSPLSAWWAELWRKTGQRGLLIASHKRLEKRLWQGPRVEAVCVLAYLVLPGSPQAKQLCHLHTQLSRRQSSHRQGKSRVYVHRAVSAVSDSLRPCRLWPVRLLCQEGGFSRQEYQSLLAYAGCHTLLEHYSSCCPSHHLPYLVQPEPLWPQQLHHLHTWASPRQTQVLQGSLRSKPQWATHSQRWK